MLFGWPEAEREPRDAASQNYGNEEPSPRRWNKNKAVSGWKSPRFGQQGFEPTNEQEDARENRQPGAHIVDTRNAGQSSRASVHSEVSTLEMQHYVED